MLEEFSPRSLSRRLLTIFLHVYRDSEHSSMFDFIVTKNPLLTRPHLKGFLTQEVSDSLAGCSYKRTCLSSPLNRRTKISAI